MNYVILAILLVLTLLMSYKNFKRIGQYKKDKTYIDLYTKVLRGEDSVHDELNSYIESENDSCLNTKARIVKAYDDLLLGNNPSEELKDVNIKNIYYENDKFSSEKAKLNSEIFVWLTLMLSKARCLSMIDLMNELYTKVNAHEEDLKILVEYQVFKSAYNSLLEKGTDGITFLKQLLQGEYSEYVYDKNLIGIYKKIACCVLAFEGEPLEDSDKEMLAEFTGTLVGNRFTRDLEIYDKYAPKEEESVEENTIEEKAEEENTSLDNDNVEKENNEIESTEEVKEDNVESSDDLASHCDEIIGESSEDNETIEKIEPTYDKEVDNVEENIIEEEKEINDDVALEPTKDTQTEEIKASIQKAEDDLLNSLSFVEDNKD